MSASRRRWPLAIYLAAWGAVLGALAGEVALRVERRIEGPLGEPLVRVNAFLQGPGLGVTKELWDRKQISYRPGAFTSFTLGGTLHEVQINSHGYRTREFAVPKPPGVLRVACIGGSTTFQGLSNDTTYPALLERRLAAALPGVELEVLNLGISGTTSEHWDQRLDRLLALEPDVVVQYRGVNDIVQLHLPGWAAAQPRRAALYRRSYLTSRLWPLPLASFDPLFEAGFERWRRLRDACRLRGAELVVATFGAPDPRSASREMRALLDGITAAWTGGSLLYYEQYWRLIGRYNERLVAFAEREAIPLVDVAARIARPALYVDICHLRPHGIERMAQAFSGPLAEILAERAAAPSPAATADD